MVEAKLICSQLRYRPGSTVPQTPNSNGYHHGEIARPGSAMPYPAISGLGSMGPPSYAQTPRPMNVVDRFRQNGRPGRDDSPLRTSLSHFLTETTADS
jgi:hypothetical protein